MDTQVRLQIDSREPFADGTRFGRTGPYEKLVGRVVFAIDPESSTGPDVADLGLAPRSSHGLVEYSTDLCILKPRELARGNRRLIYDVNNRGNKRILQYFNDAVHSNEPSAVEHAGNGFLMRRGYTVVWSGWQGDILPGEGRLTVRVPAATESGRAITGRVRSEIIVDAPGTVSYPLSGNDYTLSYETASLDTSSAIFTRREYEWDARVPIPPDEWRFASVDDDGRPVVSPGHCHLPAGFTPGWIYEIVYTAKDPLVLGFGFTGVRDLVAFLLRGDVDDAGTPNPLTEDGRGIERAYAWGRSQSGRFLREFVYRGFNQDARGRRVFDAISPHVSGGGRVVLNYRFAQPGRYPRQHADHRYPSDQFPFAYPVTTDPLTGVTDGILKRPDTDPLVLHTQTSSEYWERRGSLVHADALGRDVADHERARVYLFSCSQHSADPLLGPQRGPHRHLSNPLNTTPLHRALMDALDDWATNGTSPPASRVPTRADETAAPADIVGAGFPAIPGVSCPVEANRLGVQEQDPALDSSVAMETAPAYGDGEYSILVPQVDADGNDVPGIRTPDVEVPLATYTGWNLRPEGSAERAMAGVVGSYLPFARTERERRDSGDVRPSLESRYRSRGHYVRAVAMAAQRLVSERLLLEEDADRYVERAATEDAGDWRT